ncbi:TetR/AcrR family transcriptional regulator C-terminal domain-containing protein [Rhizohabitans arisaemae]|uniref:TetR/AcrR family transcriptional regulator C-terminal domain-containing protein n=1 Tax=Rhizohabitans arisaemae TaxID=2720610 RepID=UPI0024B23DD7|nr:TetR/AcrR family transcriptional regulator C-terminal domain-containing protein [Rhizohabitans arisaemae]
MSTSEMQNVWFRATATQRGAPPLSRDRIVAEAVALLDEEGVGRLTMRRLAERLGTGSTTLYWHVKTKDDVLDLALDTIFDEVRVPAGGGDWQEDVRALLRGWLQALLNHPWSTTLLSRPLMGPNVLTRSEFLHATLAAAGFAGQRLTGTAYALSNYVIGSAMMQATWQAGDEEEVREAAKRHLHAQRDRYPTLATHDPLVGDEWKDAFELGLDYLLTGIQSQLAVFKGA